MSMSPIVRPNTTKDSAKKVRILIADDYPVIRRMVRSTLENYPRFEVLPSEAQDGAQAITEANKLKPDVVVMNVTMPVLNGFQAAREIKAHQPETAIVILSTDADDRFVEEAKRIGARAYVAKAALGKVLVETIEAAMAGADFVLMK